MFTDRRQAGRALAATLAPLASTNPLVLALPRGGVPLGREIADALGAELDVLIVRKLGAPANAEFAFGAVGEGNAVVLDQPTINALGISAAQQSAAIEEARTEVRRRVDAYRDGHPLPDLTGRTVIVVDDGLATGATAAAGVEVVRHLGAAHVVLAVPTGSEQAVQRLGRLCDEVVCLEIPAWFGSVGAQYEYFPQVSDAQVIADLHGAP